MLNILSRNYSCQVQLNQNLTKSLNEASLIEEMREIDGIIIRANGKVTRKMMASDPKLKVIGKHGMGVENIDPEAAMKGRIWIVNAPDANDISVAEMPCEY